MSLAPGFGLKKRRLVLLGPLQVGQRAISWRLPPHSGWLSSTN